MDAAPRTGELPDSALETVAGGVVLSGNQIWRMCCRKCGWISRWYDATNGDMNPSDFFQLSYEHDNAIPMCVPSELDVYDGFYLPD